MLRKSSNSLKAIGFLLIAVAIVINLNIIGKLLAQDGNIDNIFLTNNFWLFRLCLFLSGVLFIMNKFYFNKILMYKKELILLAVVALIGLIMIEFVSFFIVKYNFTHLAFRNKILHYDNLEYNITSKFNSKGFRDEEFDLSKRYRIAVVGDSFVFGAGVNKNETLEDKLEKKLNKNAGGVAVYNLGISGAYLSDYLDLMKEMLPILKPNLTIVTIYLENDFVCENGGVLTRLFFPSLRKLIKKTFLENPSKQELSIIADKSMISKRYRKAIFEGKLTPYLLIQGHYHPDVKENYLQIVNWFENCKINKNLLQEIKNTMLVFNSDLLLVLIPPRYQVSSYNWDVLSTFSYKLDASLLKNVRLQKSILSFCSQKNITCIDLLPYLRSSEKALYFNLDTHFNSEGHNITANVISDFYYKSLMANN